jgi:nucleoside-diphosphate-sugar epimerase
MPRRKVLICGATGFIGCNLTQQLAPRPDLEVHAVRLSRPAYSYPGVTWHQADLRRPDDVARVVDGMDIVIQGAATTSGSRDILQRPHIHVTDNALMNSLLLRQAYDSKVKHFIFFSCTVMLPSSARPLSETDWDANAAMTPAYFPSGWTKVYVEKMCEFFAGLGATRHTVIRHSNIYGPHDKFDLERSHVFGATVTKVMTATDGRVAVWGRGEEARDLLYVDDLVDFVTRAIECQKEPFALYNCGSGIAVKVKDLVRSIVAGSGRSLAIEHDLSKPSIETSVHLDCRKAERELGWRPNTSLEEGIRRTLVWWKANIPSTTQRTGEVDMQRSQNQN